MSHPNKNRSRVHENEIVETAEELGFEAERAYASVGESLVDSDGDRLTEDVDVVIRRALPSGEDLKVQAKRRKRDNFASYLLPEDGGIVWLESPELFVIPDEMLLRALQGEKPDPLRLPVRTETRSRVAKYIQPDENAHVQGVRRDHDTTTYMVTPEPLARRVLMGKDEGPTENNESNAGEEEALREARRRASEVITNLIERRQ